MIKINVSTSDSYRRLIKQFQANNVHHTYQRRGERTYRVVLRHLHHSIQPDVIKGELEGLGHIARNVFKIRHRLTKAPLPLYFVDLETCDNNKSIFYLHFLCNMKITVEAPRKKNSIVQCSRCQSYGHTKTYCARPFVCVKCDGDHDMQSVPKIPLPRRRAPFVAGPIQLIIKVAMSTAVSRQPWAILLPDHGVLILARPLHTLILATLITSLPCYTLTPLSHP